MNEKNVDHLGRSWNPIWEDVFSSQRWGKYPGEEIIRFIAKNFYNSPKRQDVRILEVGCGPGANIWYLAREGFSFSGIDGSRTAIELAEKLLDQENIPWRENPDNKLIVGDIRMLPFPNGYFDAVLDNEAVYCNDFQTSVQIYKECARVLKENGKIFSRTFGKGCWGDETGQKISPNMWICAEGPLAGKGASRFTSSTEIFDLMLNFEIESIEKLSITYNSLKNEIVELIIIGKKLASERNGFP